ncbi:hypothetical protein H0H87_006714 [Tephrocybe sp. NHM501043]|nr:hypothetical protein H0H87_006714 [Tephrocybe sp. NHM501043]
MQVLTSQYLESTKLYKQQNKEKLELVRKKLMSKFPVLDDYNDTWPINHILISQLKYSSMHTKGSNVKSMVASVQSAVAESVKT